MSDPLISVVVPTIQGRERYLEQCLEAYEQTANVELLVFHDLPCCGEAWVKGAAQATGEFLHFSADDLVPHPGWWPKAVVVSKMGFLPAPRIVTADGSLQSCGDWEVEMPNGAVPQFTRIPFMSRTQWDQIGPLIVPFLGRAHYYTDNAFSWAGRRLGMETAVVRSYEFTHHTAEEGRGAGMTWDQRMEHDHRLFMEHIQ